jgi:hypothetical protein
MFTSTIANEERAVLTEKLENLGGGSGFTGKAPGGPSRWSTERSGEWEPVGPALVGLNAQFLATLAPQRSSHQA